MSHSKTDETIIFEGSHLTVGLSPLEAILIDKIQVGRTKRCARHCKIDEEIEN